MRYTAAQVLTITTGRLLCDMGDVYAIASGILGRSVFTHELPAAFRECKPWILSHAPQLEPLAGEDMTPANCRKWLANAISQVGDEFEIPRITYSVLAEKSPLDTAAEIFGAENVTVVDVRPTHDP